jgi:hypothetical protein
VRVELAPEEPKVVNQVKFEDTAPPAEGESDSDSESESESDEGDDVKPPIAFKTSDEKVDLEFVDLDEKSEAPKKKEEDDEDEDVLKEIEGKATETLVLNL